MKSYDKGRGGKEDEKACEDTGRIWNEGRERRKRRACEGQKRRRAHKEEFRRKVTKKEMGRTKTVTGEGNDDCRVNTRGERRCVQLTGYYE